MTDLIHDVEEKVEDAALAVMSEYLDANVRSECKMMVGMSDDTLEHPAIIILARDATPLSIGEQIGNYTVNLALTVETHFQEHSREDHRKIVAAVRDVVYRDDFLTLINNTASKVTTYLVSPVACPRDVRDNEYRSTGVVVELECHPKKA